MQRPALIVSREKGGQTLADNRIVNSHQHCVNLFKETSTAVTPSIRDQLTWEIRGALASDLGGAPSRTAWCSICSSLCPERPESTSTNRLFQRSPDCDWILRQSRSQLVNTAAFYSSREHTKSCVRSSSSVPITFFGHRSESQRAVIRGASLSKRIPVTRTA